MRYRVLGTTRALTDDGTPVALGGARLRALLTSLALRPGRVVPVPVLVGDVWDGDRPGDAVAALQALVGRLRRTLGHDAIASAEGGYRLVAAPDDIDLHRFGRLTAEGARALDAGDPAGAEALLTEALGLWTGLALADLPDGSRETARWETRRRDARRARLAAALALGRAEQSLPELGELCEEFPLDEPLWALRIRALADASRTAEALDAYERVRRILADRLGADPGPELRSLHARLLDTSSEPAAPAEAPGRPAEPTPRPASAAGVPHDPAGNLRARFTSFVGREEDMAAIGEDLARARLVTLLGPGGSGKTRLSQEAAEAAARRVPGAWPDGVWLAELAPVADPAAVPEAVLSTLGARETVLRGAGAEGLRAADPQANAPLARLAEHCGPRRMLLILDNCEHLVDAAAELAEHLLAHCPRLTVLATSREPLGVPGEVLRPVEPLPPEPAHRLFAERGRAARPGFEPGADPEATAEICRRLDGLPLAIELAAARLRMLSPRQIADRLDDRFRLLTSGSRTVLPRQQTLRAVVDWSWDLLDDDERAVLARLSVFAGGCDLAAAEAVCAQDGGARDVMAALGSLVDKSLVVAAPGPRGDMRYRLLETVNEYAAGRLDESGGRADAERRHLVHYRELARTTDPLLRGVGQASALALLQREYENIRAALRRATDAADEQEALCLVLSLGWYWQLRDLRAEARLWSSAAAGLGPDPFAEPVRPAPPIEQRCTDAPPPMAQDLLEEARREVGLMSLVTVDSGDETHWGTPEAIAWMRRVAAVYRSGLPQTCRFPAMFWFLSLILTGEAERLMDGMDETVRTCEELGLEWELAAALQLRANMLANRTAWSGDASRDAERAMEIFARLGDAWGTAEALSARGEAREKRGDHIGAVEDYAAAIRHAERLGATGHIAILRARLAVNLMETGAGDEGEKILREILGQDREDDENAGPSPHEAVPAARLFLTTWLGRTGRITEAREQLELTREAFSSQTVAIFEGFTEGLAAWLHAADGRYGSAHERALLALENARTPMARMIAPEMPAIHLLTLAWAMAGAVGAPSAGAGPVARAYDAARLIGAYRALLPDGHHPAPLERDILDGACDAALTALGGDTAAFDAARERGAELTLEDAVELGALRRDGARKPQG